MKNIDHDEIKKIVLDEVAKTLKNGGPIDTVSVKNIINEDFTRSEKQELSRIIRNELARIFYDLFKKRNFWT